MNVSRLLPLNESLDSDGLERKLTAGSGLSRLRDSLIFCLRVRSTELRLPAASASTRLIFIGLFEVSRRTLVSRGTAKIKESTRDCTCVCGGGTFVNLCICKSGVSNYQLLILEPLKNECKTSPNTQIIFALTFNVILY